MERSKTQLPFLDILINKTGTLIWMDIYTKKTDSKRYVPFTSNHPKHCLKNIPFSLARRICTIVENEKIKMKRMQELQINLEKQHYPKSLIESGIKRALEIPIEQLRESKPTKEEDTLTFISTFNPNNPNVFPIIRQCFNNLSYSKSMSKVTEKKTLINSKRQAPNLQRLLCKSNFHSTEVAYQTKHCGKNCVCCPYLLTDSSYKFKRVNKTFNLKTNFDCESKNLIYVVICETCKEEYIGETGCTVKQRLNIYRQHIRQPEYQQIDVEEHLRLCSNGKFCMFPFFQIRENNKTLRKAYETYFIDKFQPLLNKRK